MDRGGESWIEGSHGSRDIMDRGESWIEESHGSWNGECEWVKKSLELIYCQEGPEQTMRHFPQVISRGCGRLVYLPGTS